MHVHVHGYVTGLEAAKEEKNAKPWVLCLSGVMQSKLCLLFGLGFCLCLEGEWS